MANKGCCWRPFGDHYGGARCSGLAADLPSRRASCWLRSCREAGPRAETISQLLKSLVTLWLRDPALQRATLIQGCLFGLFSALSTILALQLDANYHLNAQFAGLFLFAPIARKIGDRRSPYTVIRLGSAIAMLAVVDDREKLSTRGGFCRTIARFRGRPPRVRARRSREEAGWTGSIASPPTFLHRNAVSFVSLRPVDSRARTRCGSCRDLRPALA